MPQYRAKIRAYFGGRVREPGDVVEMDCTPDKAGAAWVPVEDEPVYTGAAKTVDEIFGPAIPSKPKAKQTPKPAS